MPNTTFETIKDIIVLGITPMVLGYMIYKQAMIGKKVDGMTSALVVAEKGKSSAEGKLEGMEKVKQEIKDTSKVVPEVQEVKIVEQAKTLEVKVKKEGDK